jgi:hypothetical protein
MFVFVVVYFSHRYMALPEEVMPQHVGKGGKNYTISDTHHHLHPPTVALVVVPACAAFGVPLVCGTGSRRNSSCMFEFE